MNAVPAENQNRRCGNAHWCVLETGMGTLLYQNAMASMNAALELQGAQIETVEDEYQ